MYKKTIKLPAIVGTIAIMEWIKAHNAEALRLDGTIFEDKLQQVAVVSLMKANTTIEGYLRRDKVECFEYKGMRRFGCVEYGWYLEVDGNVYYCSM
jgi:hypothetical protein